jgi:MFS family permease
MGWQSRKRISLILLVIGLVAAMSAWFATTASLAAIREHWVLTPFHEALLTSSVQAGFVIGTLTSALLGLPDRFDLRNLFCGSAMIACVANLLILLCEPTSLAVPVLRLITGMSMAGIYPVGMKIASSWAKGDLGLLMGIMVGALTLGSSLPHALAGLGGIDWRIPIVGAVSGTLLAASLIRFVTVGAPPAAAPKLQPRNALQAFRNRPLLLANLGYFGHMWELYAMWTWISTFLAASFAQRYGNTPPFDARFAAAAVVAAGAIGCFAGGWSADRWGRTLVTIVSMAISGSCAALIGFSYGGPIAITLAIAIIWGVTVISDSAQFSAAVSELSDRSLIGTMLTVQMCVGFLITLFSIHLVPYAIEALGFRFAFATLAIGPALGVLAMLRLRAQPAASRLASGKR